MPLCTAEIAYMITRALIYVFRQDEAILLRLSETFCEPNHCRDKYAAKQEIDIAHQLNKTLAGNTSTISI